MAEQYLHLRINNPEGRIVGILDIPESKLPDNFENGFLDRVTEAVQVRYKFPVTVHIRSVGVSETRTRRR